MYTIKVGNIFILMALISIFQNEHILLADSKTDDKNIIENTVYLKWSILDMIVDNKDNIALRNKYLPKLLEMDADVVLGELKNLDPTKPVWVTGAGWRAEYNELLSFVGFNYIVSEWLREFGIDDSKSWFISNLTGTFEDAKHQADEAAFGLAGHLIKIKEAYPNQPLFIIGPDLFIREVGEATMILDKLGYTGQNAIIEAIFPIQPAIENELFSKGGRYYDSIQRTVKSKVYPVCLFEDDIMLAFKYQISQELFQNNRFTQFNPKADIPIAHNIIMLDLPPDEINGEMNIAEEHGGTTYYDNNIYYGKKCNQVKGYWKKLKEQYDFIVKGYGRNNN